MSLVVRIATRVAKGILIMGGISIDERVQHGFGASNGELFDGLLQHREIRCRETFLWFARMRGKRSKIASTSSSKLSAPSRSMSLSRSEGPRLTGVAVNKTT